MKRIMVVWLTMSLLLIGCNTVVTQPPTTSDTTATSEMVVSSPSNTDVTDASEVMVTTVPTDANVTDDTTVTLWLLDQVTMFDNGSSQYHYDEHYNVDHCEHSDMEREVVYTTYYEQRDPNGMPRKIRDEWPEGTGNTTTVEYFADGKIKEELQDGSNFSGTQYDYNEKGDMSAQRAYYEGALESTIYYEYTNGVLSTVVCEDPFGSLIYDCRVENGLLKEKIYYADSESYRYAYEYDQYGNRIKETLYYEGEVISVEQYTYFAANVSADRASYIMQQQNMLVPIA